MFQVFPGKTGIINGKIVIPDDDYSLDNSRNFDLVIPSQIAIKIIGKSENELLLLDLALNAGAEDCISYDENIHEIHCEKEKVYKVKKLVENEIDSFISTGIEWMPLIFIEANDNEKDDIVSFLETLEDDEDVQNVYHNLEISEELLSEM